MTTRNDREPWDPAPDTPMFEVEATGPAVPPADAIEAMLVELELELDSSRATHLVRQLNEMGAPQGAVARAVDARRNRVLISRLPDE